ncbi:MerR family DNA-binding transcriptional regulator [Coprobacillaceae bacterium CR2/5/TPMF4]|nr:MerR family DNA-binding transcriptional regulator [Coprobacillaceae bacterium CR2/5/TPMF4]
MTIAEVSKKFDISSTTLRYYEKIGLMNPVSKNASGHRDYQKLISVGSILSNVCEKQE